MMGQAKPVSWVWHGYLAAGRVTLLTSQWKMGKTTLLAALLAKMQNGGELAGLSVPQGQALVVSEENPGHWAYRAQRFGLTSHGVICQPFHHKPTAEDWAALIGSLAAPGRRRKITPAAV